MEYNVICVFVVVVVFNHVNFTEGSLTRDCLAVTILNACFWVNSCVNVPFQMLVVLGTQGWCNHSEFWPLFTNYQTGSGNRSCAMVIFYMGQHAQKKTCMLGFIGWLLMFYSHVLCVCSSSVCTCGRYSWCGGFINPMRYMFLITDFNNSCILFYNDLYFLMLRLDKSNEIFNMFNYQV